MGRFSRISRKDFQVKYWVLDDQDLIRKIDLIEKVFLNISPENLTQGRFPRFSQEGSSDRWINRDQPSGRQLFFFQIHLLGQQRVSWHHEEVAMATPTLSCRS